MKKTQEANIVSFRILFNRKGCLISEIGGLPLADTNKVFTGVDLQRIKTVIRVVRQRIETLPKELENELSALNTII